MNEANKFLLTVIENEKEDQIAITVYNGDKAIAMETVDKPAIHTDSETLKKVDDYIHLYTGLKDEEYTKIKTQVLEKIQWFEWKQAAEKKIAELEKAQKEAVPAEPAKEAK